MPMDADFWTARRSDRESDVVNGRYRLPDPATGEQRSWTRASNYGYVIADQYALTRWRHRQIIRGIRARTDLQQLVTVLDPDDAAKVDEVVSTALEVAGTTEQANRGTAIHEALALADRGQEYPEWARPYVDGYRAELARHGLQVVLVERLLINRDRESAGRTDRVYRTADGRYVVGDVKTGEHLELQAGEIAIQVENYVGASHLQTEDGTFRPLDAPLDREEAVVVHVDRETGACAVYQIPMVLARYGTNLAMQVRGWHRMGRLLLQPYVRPSNDVPVQVAAPLAPVPTPSTPPDSDEGAASVAQQRHLQAVPNGPIEGQTRTTVVDGDEWLQQFTGGQWVNISQTGRTVTDFSYAGGVPDRELAATLRTAEDLLSPRVTKAQVQQYAREHGLTDLAHTKKVLVAMLGSAGKLSGSNAATVAALHRDDTVKPSGPPAPTEDPDDPRTEAFRRVALARIATAATVGELGQYHQSVVHQYGDQAWSDALTEAARARVEQLDAAGGLTGGAAPNVLTRLLDCQTQQQIAQLWEEVTVGGSVPDRWGPEVQRAAGQRLEQIRASLPPAAANPFAGGE